jgi:hypothetical protein
MWASVVRIIATALIFIFHFLGQSDLPTYDLDYYGITLFLFISGWFSYSSSGTPHNWLIKRVRKIMIPYWAVLTLVYIINLFIHYRKVTFLHVIYGYLGLNLFVPDRIYIISWFITKILFFYVIVYLIRTIKGTEGKIILLIMNAVLFRFILGINFIYFIAFFTGYCLKIIKTTKHFPPLVNVKYTEHFLFDRINGLLFHIQNYSYPFFLIHGLFMLFIVKQLHLTGWFAFNLTLVLSAVGAVVLHRAVNKFC